MFQILLELGRCVAARQGKVEVSELLRDPIPEEYENAIVVRFDEQSQAYLGCEAIELSPSARNEILYKKGHSAGSDATGVSMFSGDPSKTATRVGKSLHAIGTFDETSSGNAILCSIAEAYETNIDQITDDVKAKHETLNLNMSSRGLLIAATEAQGKRTPIWATPAARRFLVSKSMGKYGEYDNTNCQRQEGVCSLCRSSCDAVFGNFSELKSYILDKPGMIAGGFAVERASHNFPVCATCAAYVALGINYAETRLTFRMAGQSYFILPQCFDDSVRNEFLTICESRKDRKTDSLHQDSLNRISEDEAEIFEEVAERFGSADQISLKLVFFKKKNNEWKILGELDHVLPSRIRAVLDAKSASEARPWRHEKQFVSTEIVREFAGGSFTKSQRNVLTHLDAIFSGNTLDEAQVLRNIVDHLLAEFRRDLKHAGFAVSRAFLLYDFYRKLQIIPSEKGEQMNTPIAEKSSYGHFLDENSEFFGAPAKRVAFLTGALVRCVMDVQYKRLNSTPFEKKLKGMRVTEHSLKRLLHDSEAKLQVYDVDHLHRDLLELLSQQWVETGKKGFDITDDEASFNFALGLNLNFHITSTYPKSGGEK